ncbi:MAG TPA: glycine zipper domain-containing protein [Flavisolibacter sp.]|nr:glycine zipper domain-containing protein [Flavisolibacter sp.]
MKKVMYRLAIIGCLTVFGGTTIPLQAQEVKKKTTKSRKAKYTAIGAAAGAGTGVAVGKNDSKSGVIGGVVGAGAGYLYGKHKDKKKGRKPRQ